MLFLVLLTAGCATETKTGGSNYYFGLVRVDRESQVAGSAVRTRSVGAYFGAESGLGYIDEFRVSMTPGCNVVVIVPDNDAAKAFAGQLNESLKEATCIFKKNNQP